MKTVEQLSLAVYDLIHERNFEKLLVRLHSIYYELGSLGVEIPESHPAVQFLIYKLKNVSIPNGNDTSFLHVCNQLKYLGGIQ